MSIKCIQDELFKMQDEKYRRFQSGLMPDVKYEKIIGIRTPELRKYAKLISGESYTSDFLADLPHTYYEENNLHGILLNMKYKDLDIYLDKLEEFLPYVDNWATCDLMSPKIFKTDLPLIYERVKIWLSSSYTFTIRFGIVVLIEYFMGDAFSSEMPFLVAGIRSDEYYVKMAIAWYFSMALVYQYDAAVEYIRDKRLDKWVHNKSIQKAIESRQIDDDTKKYLRSLKI